MVTGRLSGPASVAILISPSTSGRWIDRDSPLLQEELARRGIDAFLVPWYEENDWRRYDLVVTGSPWDLFFRPEEFVVWLDDVENETEILNAPSIIRWVLDKHYLGGLAEAGLSVVPTAFFEVGQEPTFPRGDFVVKPVTSGGAINTARYRQDEVEAATAHVRLLHDQSMSAMVQPYLDAIDASGERSLIFIGGVFDHAVTKGAMLKRDEALDTQREPHPQPKACTATVVERELAEAAIAMIPGKEGLLHGRVDLITAPDGVPAILELELIAPMLFLAHSDGGVDRYADAVVGRLEQRRVSLGGRIAQSVELQHS